MKKKNEKNANRRKTVQIISNVTGQEKGTRGQGNAAARENVRGKGNAGRVQNRRMSSAKRPEMIVEHQQVVDELRERETELNVNDQIDDSFTINPSPNKGML